MSKSKMPDKILIDHDEDCPYYYLEGEDAAPPLTAYIREKIFKVVRDERDEARALCDGLLVDIEILQEKLRDVQAENLYLQEHPENHIRRYFGWVRDERGLTEIIREMQDEIKKARKHE